MTVGMRFALGLIVLAALGVAVGFLVLGRDAGRGDLDAIDSVTLGEAMLTTWRWS